MVFLVVIGVIFVAFVVFLVLMGNKRKQLNVIKEQLKKEEEEKEAQERADAEALRKQQEKEQLREKIQTGKININVELDNIEKVLKMCFDNGQEFREKFRLLSEWSNCGGSGAQADNLWEQSKMRYGDSPLSTVRNHTFMDCPDALLEKLEMLREIHNDDRIDSMISTFKEIKGVLYKLQEIQKDVNRKMR